MGRARNSEEKFAEAVAALNRAIEINPQLTTAYNARGFAHLRLKQFAQAVADFSEAIRLNPKYSNAYHNRAVARRRIGDRAGAAEDDLNAQKFAGSEKRAAAPLAAER
jgi:tetratricopeptide (TPR) repeat protein